MVPPDSGVEVVGPIDKSGPGGEARMSALYQAADVFCMPSRFEAFGVVFVEAMLHGVCCIGTDHCAMPEIIERDETGWLVPDGDVGELGRRLIVALSDRTRLDAMGSRARLRALDLFTWDAVARRMVEHIEAAVARRGVVVPSSGA